MGITNGQDMDVGKKICQENQDTLMISDQKRKMIVK